MNRSNVEEIKARLPVEEVVGQYVKLEKAGKSLRAKCPFHHEKTASFYVSPDRGGYYCFGCGAKGDIFSFVEQFEGLDFKGALKVLAERAGVPLVFDQKADSERDRLFRIMEEAALYFEGQLAKSKEAQEYITKRGVTDKTRQEFRIGWVPDGWRNLHDHLKSKKWSEDIIVKAGLAKEADDKPGTFYDRFRGRVMFPISDSSGRVIAFTGRILKDDGKSAKYLNSPDMPLYDKSSVLYGLDRAKGYIRRLGYSIMVEGQMDLIMSHQAGVKNVVAASGTALTDAESNREGAVNNLGLLRRLSNNVIIAFDSDAAGRKAAMRASGIALSLGMDVKVADIQGGKDPADLVLANVEDWKNVLRTAKPVIEFELANVIRDTPDARKVPKALRDRVLPFVALLDSSTDKAYAVKLVADRADLPEQAVWDDVREIGKKIAEEAKGSSGPVSSPAGAAPASRLPSQPPKAPSNPLASSASRIDLVERRMLGLLDLMERSSDSKAPEYRSMIEKIAGESYASRIERAKPLLSDMSFEAEALFGTEAGRWGVHMADLIANFEIDIINEDLMQTMSSLRAAEKAGDQAKVANLAKKCQVLSIRKAEVGKKAK